MYYFFIGSYEKGGFQNDNLKDSKYIGRVKTKEKFLALEDPLGVDLYSKEKLKDESSIIFFDKNKIYIIGDLYYIEDEKIINKIDCLYEVGKDYGTYKKNIQVRTTNEKQNTIEAFSYFMNVETLKEELNRNINIVNEYSNENKTHALETMLNIKQIRGNNSKDVFFNKLKEENK